MAESQSTSTSSSSSSISFNPATSTVIQLKQFLTANNIPIPVKANKSILQSEAKKVIQRLKDEQQQSATAATASSGWEIPLSPPSPRLKGNKLPLSAAQTRISITPNKRKHAVSPVPVPIDSSPEQQTTAATKAHSRRSKGRSSIDNTTTTTAAAAASASASPAASTAQSASKRIKSSTTTAPVAARTTATVTISESKSPVHHQQPKPQHTVSRSALLRNNQSETTTESDADAEMDTDADIAAEDEDEDEPDRFPILEEVEPAIRLSLPPSQPSVSNPFQTPSPEPNIKSTGTGSGSAAAKRQFRHSLPAPIQPQFTVSEDIEYNNNNQFQSLPASIQRSYTSTGRHSLPAQSSSSASVSSVDRFESNQLRSRAFTPSAAFRTTPITPASAAVVLSPSGSSVSMQPIPYIPQTPLSTAPVSNDESTDNNNTPTSRKSSRIRSLSASLIDSIPDSPSAVADSLLHFAIRTTVIVLLLIVILLIWDNKSAMNLFGLGPTVFCPSESTELIQIDPKDSLYNGKLCTPCPLHGICSTNGTLECEPRYVRIGDECVYDRELNRTAQRIFNQIIIKLESRAGEFDCNLLPSNEIRGVSMKDIESYSINETPDNQQIHSKEIFTEIRTLLLSHLDRINITDSNGNLIIESINPNFTIYCTVKLLIFDYKWYIILFTIIILFATYLYWRIKQWYSNRLLIRNTADQVRYILSEYSSKPIAIDHLRDSLGFHSTDNTIWNRVIELINYDSRIQSSRSIKGAINRNCWQWTAELKPKKPAIFNYNSINNRDLTDFPLESQQGTIANSRLF